MLDAHEISIMFDVHEIFTSLPHIHIPDDFIRFVVLLASQKDYEHYTARGFESKVNYLKNT